MVTGTKWLAKPGGGIPPDGQKPVSQPGLVQVPDPVEALTDRDGHRRGLRFAGQRRKLLDQPMSLLVLDVKAHHPPFYPIILPGYPPWSCVALDGAAHAAGTAAAAA